MLAYSEYGSGAALVLLHAFPLDRTLWREVAQPLAADGWHVVVPDLPGFGQSEETVASIDDMATSVANLLDHLSVQSAVVGGCSMGGYVAMAFARLYPERTAGLLLVDTKANADGADARANRERIASQVESAGSTEALAVTQPDAMFSAATRDQLPSVVDWLLTTIRAQAPVGVAAAQRAMAGRADQFDMLANLRVPVLCIRGAEDAIAGAADHSAMAATAHDALDITVDGAGHLVPIEQPAAFVEHVRAFLRSVRGPSC